MSICKHDWELKPINSKWLWVCKYCNQVLAYKNVDRMTMRDEERRKNGSVTDKIT